MKKYKISSYLITINSQGNFSLKLYQQKKGGSNFYVLDFKSKLFCIHTPYAINPELIIDNYSDLTSLLDNTFTSFVYDKKLKSLVIENSYFGLQTVYYLHKSNKVSISPLIHHLDISDKIEVDDLNLEEHLTLGYTTNQKSVFKDVDIFKKRSTYKISDNLDVKITRVIDKIKESKILFNEDLKSKLELSIISDFENVEKPNLGITSGKDSLAILSILIQNNKAIKSSNFGNPKAQDIIIGEKISEVLDLNYRHVEFCNTEEFNFYSKQISYFGSGLTTASYVDMVKYVDMFLDNDESYVMGEGGECIRTFFEDKKSFDKYITPENIIKKIFKKNNYGFFKSYFDIDDQIINEFGIDYYREERLTGNFSKRHSILQPYVNKVSPFLNKKFISLAFQLDTMTLKKHPLHDYFAARNNTVNAFYNLRSENGNDTQLWSKRLSIIIEKLQSLHGDFNYKKWNITKDGVENIIKTSISNERAVYFLLRFLPLIEFLTYSGTDYYKDIEEEILHIKL